MKTGTPSIPYPKLNQLYLKSTSKNGIINLKAGKNQVEIGEVVTLNVVSKMSKEPLQ